MPTATSWSAANTSQRYYDPMIGRFLSVDPVTADSATGANFNRYWYGNNNPYKFKDPDGRYTCTGEGCGRIDAAYLAAQRKVGGMKNGKERHDAEVALKQIGEKGKSGAKYETGALDGKTTTAQFNAGTGVTTIDLSKVSSTWQLASNMAHEIRHQNRCSKASRPSKDKI